MSKYICSGCKANFYADSKEEDCIIGEQFFCSYCYPKVRVCGICGKSKVLKYLIKTEAVGICPDCQIKGNSFPNIWLMLRFKTFSRDNFTCRYCGRSPLKEKDVILHSDHLIPKSNGGQNILDNLVTSCRECNSGKIDVMLEQYQIDKIKNR